MATEVRAVEADIPMGMTQVEDGDAKVLLIRDANGLRAFQAECPHAGAPLAEGAICGRTLYCPWHKAAFNIGDGALLEPPALDGLAQYPIRTEGEKIVVALEPMAEARPSTRAHDARTFVIVGSGAAAAAAIKTLRHEGFGGKLVVIGREAGNPYDRTILSKFFLSEKSNPGMAALETKFHASHGVEFLMGPATRIEPAKRSVTLQNGSTITGDALLVATGSRPVVPHFAGGDLKSIFALRSLEDAVALNDAAETARTVTIIGGGFIGLEAASFLTKRGLSATVVTPEPLPLATRFGDDIAHALKVYHEGTGIRFIQGKVARFEGEGRVTSVRLEGGDTLTTDLVLIGAGASPETAIIDAPKRDDGSIAVDSGLKLAPGVWLAGDIAAFPEAHSGTIARIEHWRLAQQHGVHAARAMLGDEAPFTGVPYFWTSQGDNRLGYAGYAHEWDRIVTHGDVGKLDFISYYIRDGKALAASANGRTKAMIAFLHRLNENGPPPLEEVEGGRLAA